jgi:exonuclease VII small subunit
MTLEQQLLRMQEILETLEQNKVALSESMPLLIEADKLRKQIIKALTEMENQIVSLGQSGEEN